MRKSVAEQRLMTCEEREAYRKAMNVARQNRYKEAHREEAREYKKNYIKKYRAAHVEKMKEQNKKDVAKHRQNNKTIKEVNNTNTSKKSAKNKKDKEKTS